jgi:hypothetical protein
MNELLDSAHLERVRQVLRMELATFYTLRDWLLANTNMGDNIRHNRRIRGHGRQVSIEEKLADIELEVEEEVIQETLVEAKSTGNTYMNKKREDIAQEM